MSHRLASQVHLLLPLFSKQPPCPSSQKRARLSCNLRCPSSIGAARNPVGPSWVPSIITGLPRGTTKIKLPFRKERVNPHYSAVVSRVSALVQYQCSARLRPRRFQILGQPEQNSQTLSQNKKVWDV